MLKSVGIILFFVSYSFCLNAQQGSIKGVVADSISGENIEYAAIALLSAKDSSYVKGISANNEGRFNLKVIPGKYVVQVSFLGYKVYKRVVETSKVSPDYDFGKIYLVKESHILDEAVVTAKTPDVVVKNDTIEYNAASYMAEESDLLQDIVKKLPGVEIDAEGNITANGKPVRKILIDGKEFFDNDIQMALKNLPANMIKKLQLFKEQSDNSKITGFKDGNEQQVLNLKVKEEYKKSLFGDVKIGYGSNDKYSNRVMANYLNGDNQYSVIGNMNNVNDDWDFGGGSSFGNFSPFSGIDKNKNAGGNFSLQKSKKFNMGGNVRYADNTNELETRTNTQYFNPDRISTQLSSTESNSKNMNLGMRFEWKPDSLTTIYFRASGASSASKNRGTSSGLTYAEQDTTTQSSNRFSKTDSYSLNGSLTVGRKLNDKGRNISLSLNGSFRKEDGNGMNYSQTIYSSRKDNLIQDQISDNEGHTRGWGVSASYVEPITSKNSVMVSYSYTQNGSDRNRNIFRKDAGGNYTVIDSAYTRNTDNFYSNQNINVSFQSLLEKYEYSIGLSVLPGYSRSKVTLGDSIIDYMKQSVVDYSPSLRFTYKPKDNISLTVDYSGSTNHPSISQLSADTVRNASGTSKTYGNPDLKTSYSNNLNIYYQKSNFEKGNYFMLMGGFSYSFNQAANYTKVDSLFNTETTYKNVNGNWNANMSVVYNTPFRNKKFTIMLQSYARYSRNVGFSNEQKNITNNFYVMANPTLSFANDKIDSRLSVDYSYNLTKNNTNENADNSNSGLGISSVFTFKLPLDFSITNDMSFSYNSGYASEFKKTEFLWNAYVSKQFLKKKAGTLKVQFFDILKDRNNVIRTVSDNITDTRTNTISRYFLVSFSYRFNIARGNKEDDDPTFVY